MTYSDTLTLDHVQAITELVKRGVPIYQIAPVFPACQQSISEYASMAREAQREHHRELAELCVGGDEVEAVEFLAVRGLTHAQIGEALGFSSSKASSILKRRLKGWQVKRDRYRRRMIERFAA